MQQCRDENPEQKRGIDNEKRNKNMKNPNLKKKLRDLSRE